MTKSQTIIALLIIVTVATLPFYGKALWSKEKESVTPVQRLTLLEQEKAAYEYAIKCGDLDAAAVSIIRIIGLDPEQPNLWKQKLGEVYFKSNRYYQSLAVCNQLLRESPSASEKHIIIQVRALCLEALDRKNQALAVWEDLFAETKNPVHAVRVASLQLQTGHVDAVNQTIRAGLSAPDVSNLSISLPKSRTEMQQVPVVAALMRLQAHLAMSKQPAARKEAQKHLEAALELEPEFELARKDLDGLNTKKNEARADRGLSNS